MSVDTHVASGAREGLALAVGNVLLRLGVAVLLGHAKINDVNDIGGLGAGTANDEVVGFDVAVDEVSLVDGLDAGEHLLGDHDDGLDGESAAAVVEEVLERGAEEVDDEDVVKTLLAKVVDIGDTGWRRIRGIAGRGWRGERGGLTIAYEDLVGAVFVSQLGSVALARFLRDGLARRVGARRNESIRRGIVQNGETDKLDGNLLVVEQVGAFENDTKRALTNLLAHAVVDTDDVGGGGGHDGRLMMMRGGMKRLSSKEGRDFFQPLAIECRAAEDFSSSWRQWSGRSGTVRRASAGSP